MSNSDEEYLASGKEFDSFASPNNSKLVEKRSRPVREKFFSQELVDLLRAEDILRRYFTNILHLIRPDIFLHIHRVSVSDSAIRKIFVQRHNWSDEYAKLNDIDFKRLPAPKGGQDKPFSVALDDYKHKVASRMDDPENKKFVEQIEKIGFFIDDGGLNIDPYGKKMVYMDQLEFNYPKELNLDMLEKLIKENLRGYDLQKALAYLDRCRKLLPGYIKKLEIYLEE